MINGRFHGKNRKKIYNFKGNYLINDEGVVLKLGKGLDHLEINGPEIKAGAGVSLVSLSVVRLLLLLVLLQY